MGRVRNIDITTIATLRPEVLRRALASVRERLIFEGNWRLILDVAPVGDLRWSQSEVIAAAREVFPSMVARANSVSHQAKAQKWVWNQANTDFILQWEDDWVLMCPLEIAGVLKIFENRPKLGMIFFDRAEKPVATYPPYQGMFDQVHPGFYLRRRAKNFGGPPAVIRREYLFGVLPFVRACESLDTTCRSPEAQAFLANWEIGVITNPVDEPQGLVKDIGKEWRQARGFKMKKNTPWGVRWLS